MKTKTIFSLLQWSVILSFVALIRIFMPPLPGHPTALSPLLSLALCAPLFCTSKLRAVILTLLIVWVSDAFINFSYTATFSGFYPGFYWQYVCYLLLVLLGSYALQRVNLFSILLTSVLGSTLFFIISNFGVWLTGNMYPMNFSGLMTCYLMAIPFYKTIILGTAVYALGFFVAWKWISTFTAQKLHFEAS
jgi:hypothetical protein